MPSMLDVRRKMNTNRAYPSDTEFFYGLTEEENNLLPFPYPRVEECDVTIHAAGTISFSRKPSNIPFRVKVSADLLAGPTLRKLGLQRENVTLVVEE